MMIRNINELYNTYKHLIKKHVGIIDIFVKKHYISSGDKLINERLDKVNIFEASNMVFNMLNSHGINIIDRIFYNSVYMEVYSGRYKIQYFPKEKRINVWASYVSFDVYENNIEVNKNLQKDWGIVINRLHKAYAFAFKMVAIELLKGEFSSKDEFKRVKEML